MSSRMWDKANFTKDSGTRRREKEMELESSFGLMGPSMKACGTKTKLMEKEE